MTAKILSDRFKQLPMPASNPCFGCGSDNAMGLGMKFYSDGRTVASPLTVPDYLCGWPRVVHGGIVATIFDEIMGWTAIYLMKKVVLTKRLSVDFKKTTPVNQPLLVEGWVAGRPDERHVLIQATIHISETEVSARGEGLFTLFPLEDAVSRNLLGPEMIDEIRTFRTSLHDD
jgi:acyl-coenzyme A thioesterase PaaI-like protein